MKEKPKRLSTIKEIAEYLRLSESTVYQMAQKGEIPGIKIGGTWRFKMEEIENWLEKKRKRGSDEKDM